MAELSRDGAPFIRGLAVLISGSVYAQNRAELARALSDWVRMHVHVYSEPEELLYHPLRLVEAIQAQGYVAGDCDDAAILLGSLLSSVGIPARFKAAFEAPDGSFGHVFTEYHDGLGWRSLDPTISFYPVVPGPWMTVEV